RRPGPSRPAVNRETMASRIRPTAVGTVAGMTRPTRTPAGAVVTITLIGPLTAGATGSLSALGWAGEQLLLVFGLARPWWRWPAVSVVNGLLVAAPAAIAALLSRSVRP